MRGASSWGGGSCGKGGGGASCPLAAPPLPLAAKQRKTVRGYRLGCSNMPSTEIVLLPDPTICVPPAPGPLLTNGDGVDGLGKGSLVAIIDKR